MGPYLSQQIKFDLVIKDELAAIQNTPKDVFQADRRVARFGNDFEQVRFLRIRHASTKATNVNQLDNLLRCLSLVHPLLDYLPLGYLAMDAISV